MYVVFSSVGPETLAAERLTDVQYAEAAQAYTMTLKDSSGTFADPLTIQIDSYSWGVTFAPSVSSVRPGSPDFDEMIVSAQTSQASPGLFLACALGEVIDEVILTSLSNDEKNQKFFEIKMTGVRVTSYSSAASGDEIPADSFSLNFSKIEFSYFTHEKDGSSGGPIRGGWDLEKGKKV